MSKFTNYELTPELEDVMKKALNFSKNNKFKEISLESVISFLIERYVNTVNGLEKLDCESEHLIELIKNLTVDDRLELLHFCTEEAYKVEQSNEVFSKFSDDSLVLSNDLDRVISRAGETKKLAKLTADLFLGNSSLPLSNKINTDLFIRSALFEECKNISTILTNYGISKESFASYYANLLEETTNNIVDKMRSGEENNNDDNSNNNNEDNTNSSNSLTDDQFEKAGQRGDIHTKQVDPESLTPALDEFATDITKAAKEGKYDPVIGREKECSEIIQILCCRKKNNAMITGVPGAGKSSIVEKLAMMIAEGNVPSEMKNKRIFSLDLNALLAGCSLRGQYEERLQKIIKEVCGSNDIIVYVDEAHNLVGNGSSQGGSGDGANILKPYLADGSFQMIGSTTDDEYRRIIEKDGALKRRFTQVRLSEPTISETVEILNGLSDKYSEYHHVKYTPEVIEACVNWSGKYINNTYFPDKAITIMDMASSVAKLTENPNKKKVEEDLDKVRKKKQKDVDNCNFAALEKDSKKEDKLLKKLNSLCPTVTIDNVADVISKVSNVPLDKIRSTDVEKIKSMREALSKRVIGQEEAVDQVTMALQRNILGLRDEKKPIASFLLTGCSGTGKSYIAKILAEEYFGSINSMELISGSEYEQDWAESKLLGSSPGYVGSEQEPRLYVLKKKPYCVMVVDEIEKFSSRLYNVWLNMLEEGEVTLSSGEKISCRNCIFVFTSNCGTKNIEAKGNGIGFSTNGKTEDFKKLDESVVMAEVKREFRPEFLNRLTKIIVFNRLSKEDLGKIFWLELKKLQDRLLESGYKLSVTDAVKDLAVEKSESQYGARSLIRNITKYVEEEVCKAMLDQDTKGKYSIKVDVKKDEDIVVKFTK